MDVKHPNVAELASAKVVELRQQIDAYKVQLDSLSAKLRSSQEQLSAWLTILKSASPVVPDVSQPSVRERAAVLRLENELEQKRTALTHNIPLRMSMMDATQIFIRQSPAGVTPKDVTDYLSTRHFEPSDGFASNALFRLKSRGLVDERDNRYYWRKNQTPA